MARRQSKEIPAVSKRFVAVTGNKGGTGKSFCARILLDWIIEQKIPCTAYDTDTENSHLYRHYKDIPPGVKRLALTEDSGIDELIDALQVIDTPLVVMDLPAQISKVLAKLESEVGIVQAMNLTGYKMTFVSVLSPIKDSVVALKLLMEQYGNGVNYVVVVNQFFDEQFTLYETSETRQKFLGLGGIEMTMPKLYPAVSKVINDKDLTFRGALEPNSPLSFSQRMRLEKWIQNMDTELDKASSLLGLKVNG